MREYGKTENLFVRDPETHKLIVGEFRDPTHAQIGRWLVTEKVNGTNIRVLLRLKAPNFADLQMFAEVRGRSDAANLPPGLEQHIMASLDENHEAVFKWMNWLVDGDPDIVVCLYGEGYGPGIQKQGGSYRPAADGKSIRLFDVTTTRLVDGEPVGTWWRDFSTVMDAAKATGLPTVSVLSSSNGSTLEEIVTQVSDGFASTTALEDGGDGLQAEGVVARTDPYLYDFRHNRVMFKLKTEDLA